MSLALPNHIVIIPRESLVSKLVNPHVNNGHIIIFFIQPIPPHHICYVAGPKPTTPNY